MTASGDQIRRELVVREVETAFRAAMEMWAYREYWRLWEVSTSESRFAMTQTDFAAQMERGRTRPATGRQVEDLKISPTSPEAALITARLGLEDSGTGTIRSVVRTFLLYYQDGRWRPQLPDFLGLASYYSATALPLPSVNGPVILVVPCCPIPMPRPKTHSVKIIAPCCPGPPPPPGPQHLIGKPLPPRP
jgi:hypothetical protein